MKPTQPSAPVHVADGPVGVVRQRVDRLDRHHRAFERAHAVERQRDDEELQDRVVAQLVPSPDSVMMPLIIPPQLGASSTSENTMPRLCVQSGSAV